MNERQNEKPSSQETAFHHDLLRSKRSNGPGWQKYSPVLAIVLYLILIDAAVETFLSELPARWFVGFTVIAYFAASVLLWRRFKWETKAVASLFVLLGLLTLAVW